MKKPLPLRIDEELLRRVDEARGDVSRTRWVERALEAALGVRAMRSPGSVPLTGEQLQARADESVAVQRLTKPVPGVMTARELAMERQARLNKAKGS